MAKTVTKLTYDDLEAIPEEREGDRHELIDGELVVTPVPITKHQIISMNLIRHLDQYVYTRDLGMVFHPPTGIRLAPDNLLIPDIIFITRDRLDVIGPKMIDGPPDLVVEILSPGTRQRDLTTKRALYARFGVPEYWIVDPEAQTATVLTLVGDHYELVPFGNDDTIRSRVLPSLALTREAVFAGIAGGRANQNRG